MSGNRLDALTVTEYESKGEKKARWTRIGVAFERDKGGWDIRLEALPINGRIMLMEPRSDRNGGGGGGGSGGNRQQRRDYDDGGQSGGGGNDDIPF